MYRNLTNSKGVDVISSYDYTYDNVGNRLSMVTQGGTTSYSYDTTYQLTNVTKPDTTTTSYSFDGVGNRTQVNNTTYITNPMNQYTQVGQNNFYDYDDNGSMISKTFDSQLTTYTYDYENRLTKVTTPSSGEVTFTYDPFGRLIQRNENTVITNYIYDGDRLLAEYDSTNNIKRTYLYGTAIDEIITMSKFFDWGVAIWYYNYDGLGSVSELTDWQGNVTEKYTYDEYGSFTIEDGQGNPLEESPSGNRFYFTGRRYDFLTGLYYYRARWYDTEIGRFLQVDPIGYDAGDINLYRYCWNNPVNWIDPWGLRGDKEKKRRPRDMTEDEILEGLGEMAEKEKRGLTPQERERRNELLREYERRKYETIGSNVKRGAEAIVDHFTGGVRYLYEAYKNIKKIKQLH